MILVRLIPFLLTMAVAGGLIVFSESHSWASSETTWGLTAVFATSAIIDITLSRWWERFSRRRARRRKRAHAPILRSTKG